MLPLLPFPVLIYENKIPENEFLQYLKLSSYEVKFSLTLHNSTGWPRSMHRYTYCAPLYNFTTARRVCSSSTHVTHFKSLSLSLCLPLFFHLH